MATKEQSAAYRAANRNEIRRKDRERYATPKRRAYRKCWQAKNKKHTQDYNRSYHAEYRARMTDAEWAAYCERHRNGKLRRQYGLTPEGFVALEQRQKGVCAICGRPQQQPKTNGSNWKTKRRLAVDHCHQTGRVRGLLCTHCNRVIALLNDDPARARRLADYLEDR